MLARRSGLQLGVGAAAVLGIVGVVAPGFPDFGGLVVAGDA
jgi:hypothetical protein